MFFALQVLCNLPIYKTSLPGNADMFRENIKNTIEFKMLNPQGIISLFVPGFELKAWLMGKKEAVIASKDQLNSILGDLEIYVISLLICILVLLLLVTLLLLKTLRKKIIQILSNIKDKMLWNGLV